METIEARNWTEFEKTVDDLEAKYGTAPPPNGGLRRTDPILFRGQPNDTWHLETTLERRARSPMSVREYLSEAARCVNELESLTEKRWNLKPWGEFDAEIDKLDSSDSLFAMKALPSYEYLLYLRHHGFPSPLLDWTTSPYIAAYFAYCDDVHADRVAVYAYVSSMSGLRSHVGGQPQIRMYGPFATTHQRHFAQKAQYTTATQWSSTGGHRFCSHDDVFSLEDEDQDLLVKITMPIGERRSFLQRLDTFNVNHFTLFQSEDALVRTMAMRRFDLT